MEIVNISLFTWLNIRFLNYTFSGISNLIILFLYKVYNILMKRLMQKKNYFNKSKSDKQI